MAGIARAPNLLTECLGFDSFSPVSLTIAKSMWVLGYRWVGRYLENLTASEVSMLHSIGFGIVLITEAVVIPLSGAVGSATGASEVAKAQSLDAPEEVHLFIDDEAVQGTLADATAYLRQKSGVFVNASYGAGLYVGANQPLSGAELYAEPSVTIYWRAGSMGLPEPTCNFAVWQISPLDLAPPELSGFRVDRNIIGADARGRSPILWWGS